MSKIQVSQATFVLMTLLSMWSPAESGCTWTGWVNSYDHTMDYTCPHNYAMSGQISQHNNGKEDRVFKVQCCNYGGTVGNAPGSLGGFNNDWDRSQKFECPAGQALKRIYSVHNNGKEDRRFKFLCGTVGGTKGDKTVKLSSSLCSWTGWINNWDGYLSYYCPTNHYLAGQESTHSNSKEDRLYKFKCCEIVEESLQCSIINFQMHMDQKKILETHHGVSYSGFLSNESAYDKELTFPELKLEVQESSTVSITTSFGFELSVGFSADLPVGPTITMEAKTSFSRDQTNEETKSETKTFTYPSKTLSCPPFSKCQEQFMVLSEKIEVPYTLTLRCTDGRTKTSTQKATIDYGFDAKGQIDAAIPLQCVNYVKFPNCLKCDSTKCSECTNREVLLNGGCVTESTCRSSGGGVEKGVSGSAVYGLWCKIPGLIESAQDASMPLLAVNQQNQLKNVVWICGVAAFGLAGGIWIWRRKEETIDYADLDTV